MDRTPVLPKVLIAALLFVGAAAAQAGWVAPGSHAASEGSASTDVPFGRSTPTRVQFVYGARLFQGPMRITGVQLRLDAGAAAGGKRVECAVKLSTCPLPLLALSAQFARNRGEDEQQVLSRQSLALPAQRNASSPRAFLPPIRFQSPFAYDPQAGALVMEVVVYGQHPGAFDLDATYACTSPVRPVGPPSCRHSNGGLLRVASVPGGVQWGRPWGVRVSGADPGDVVLLAIGSRESGAWAGLQLPQDLAVAGASGCFVSIDVGASFFGAASSDGSLTFPFVIPDNPQLLRKWLRFQATVMDPAANSLGLVTSQAQKVQICGREPVGRVWSDDLSSPRGAVALGVAAVARFLVTQ